MRIERYLSEIAGRVVAETTGVDQDPILRPTQDAKHGDYQINAAMALGKKLGKKPRDVAEPLATALAAEPCIASAEVAGPGFVNLRLDDAWVAARLGENLADRERDGAPPVDAPETIVVDFSAPNVAKPMHVGHLRSTIIGDALCRMLRFAGHRVIGDNHIGDWGTQFGLLIVGMREWGDEAALAREPIEELVRVYKLANARAKEDEAFAESARRELAKLQAGDAENRALWERFVRTSRVALDRVYDRLDVHFDEWRGESAYDDMLPGVVETLLETGIAREDQGAICVFFDQRYEHEEQDVVPKELKKQKAPFIVRKKDGAYLYSTSDIATVLYRRDTLHADRAIYVVDSGQSLHFKQLFAVVRLLGVSMALEHVGFGVVLQGGKKLRTRDATGRMITLESLLDEAERRAEERIRTEERILVPDDDIPKVAEMVGIGAVKWADLKQNRNSDYEFDWDKMVSFSGNAGPYMQYAHARTQNIFREGDVDPSALAGPIVLEAPQERALALRLARFGEVVHQAADSYLPHFLCDHLFELSQAFSAFYAKCHVLGSSGPTLASRLALVDLTGRQLRRGLALLGIEAPSRM